MKKRIISLLALLIFFFIAAFASETSAAVVKNLKKDADLKPVNWSTTLRFKAGRITVDGYSGAVVEGVIAQNYSIKLYGNPGCYLTFKGGTTVRFENAGGVKEGVLAGTTSHYIEWSKASITLAGGTKVTFGYGGGVTFGTLAKDSTLPLYKGGSATFKAGTQVKFDSGGKVTASSAPPVAGNSPYAGKYKGAFAGAAKGIFTAVSGSDGVFSATLVYEGGMSITVTGSVDSKGNIYCSESGGVCKGKFSGNKSCSGTWSYGKDARGSWKANKIN